MSAPAAFNRVVSLSLLCCGLGATGMAGAQDGSKPVYRCPGPPVLYTDAITVQEAKEKGCRTIEGAPVTVVQTTPRPKPVPNAAAGAAAGANPASGNGSAAPTAANSGNPGNRIDPSAQRARDTDARRILGEELRAEEERLVSLQRDYNNGEPERRGDERNFQRYADRVAEMKAGILRKEADIAALRRELAKLPP